MVITFNQKNSNKNNKKLKPVNRIGLGTDFPFDQGLKRKIHQIQLLVGVTQADFDLLYVEMIKNLCLSYESLLHDILKITIRALKRRRGYLLPVGSDSEVSFREHEVWTYAVFTSAILQCLLLIYPCHSIENLKSIIPSQGLLWLKRHAVLIGQWNNYLLDHEATVFAELIHVRLEKEDESEFISISSC